MSGTRRGAMHVLGLLRDKERPSLAPDLASSRPGRSARPARTAPCARPIGNSNRCAATRRRHPSRSMEGRPWCARPSGARPSAPLTRIPRQAARTLTGASGHDLAGPRPHVCQLRPDHPPAALAPACPRASASSLASACRLTPAGFRSAAPKRRQPSEIIRPQGGFGYWPELPC
jgi:hypothetical protein